MANTPNVHCDRLIVRLALTIILSFTVSLAQASDLRILLDVSQSMAQNDPENHRREALMQMIDTIPNGDKAGVWTFGQYINLLVPHENVDSGWRRRARAEIQSLGAPAIRTNIGGVLDKAGYDFDFSSYGNDAEVILITDGRVDIAPNDGVNQVERSRVLNQLVPMYQRANAKIHTVALSDQADHELLKALASETGGNYYRVTNPGRFVDALFNIRTESATMAAQEQMTSEQMQPEATEKTAMAPANRRTSEFTVEDSMQELTVVVKHSRGAVSLVSPSGKEYSAVAPGNQNWRVSQGMTQVTVSNPDVGRWSVMAESDDNPKVMLLPGIRLQWTIPETSSVAKYSTIQIEAELTDMNGNAVPELLDVEAMMRVNGRMIPVMIRNRDLIANLPADEEMAVYDVELSVDGGTFERQLRRQLHAIEPYISELLMKDDAYEWRLYPSRYLEDVESVQASVAYEVNGTVKAEPFVQHEAGYWVWRLPYSGQQGTYDVKLRGDIQQDGRRHLLAAESQLLTLPPSSMSGQGMAMSLGMGQSTPMPVINELATSEAFVKEPMPMFEELVPELVVSEPAPMDAPAEPEMISRPAAEPVPFLTYALLALGGVVILTVAYVVYRRFETGRQLKEAQGDLLTGEEELSGLENVGGSEPDPDLDLSDIDDEMPDELVEAETSRESEIDALLAESEVSIVADTAPPPPENTEAPTPAFEDMLDEGLPEELLNAEEPEGDAEEELFDISSVDDDLADLDLALDGTDDPFADIDDSDPKN